MPSYNTHCNLASTTSFYKDHFYEWKKKKKVGLYMICYWIKMMPQNGESLKGTRRTVGHLSFNIDK